MHGWGRVALRPATGPVGSLCRRSRSWRQPLTYRRRCCRCTVDAIVSPVFDHRRTAWVRACWNPKTSAGFRRVATPCCRWSRRPGVGYVGAMPCHRCSNLRAICLALGAPMPSRHPVGDAGARRFAPASRRRDNALPPLRALSRLASAPGGPCCRAMRGGMAAPCGRLSCASGDQGKSGRRCVADGPIVGLVLVSDARAVR